MIGVTGSAGGNRGRSPSPSAPATSSQPPDADGNYAVNHSAQHLSCVGPDGKLAAILPLGRHRRRRRHHPHAAAMKLRASTWIAWPCSACSWLAFAAPSLDAACAAAIARADAAATRALAARLGLTDLALFTEARYTRHPSQADLHSAFQDHPLALEHFPSGSLIVPHRHEHPGSRNNGT